MSKVRVGLVQMSCTADKQENLQKAIEKVKEAAKKGAQIVCLQELFTSLYFCDVEDYENFKLAEAIPGPSTDALSAVAKELGVVIIASLFEKKNGRTLPQYNGSFRCRWNLPGQIPQDAYPR
ncbi:MAG: hypothetical protein NVV59_00865 [Chitinophagaceae bacterium]|nr:hypothetical protein [Chitinophagaceae bacterium]